jgi:hypothetical protein
MSTSVYLIHFNAPRGLKPSSHFILLARRQAPKKGTGVSCATQLFVIVIQSMPRVHVCLQTIYPHQQRDVVAIQQDLLEMCLPVAFDRDLVLDHILQHLHMRHT